MVGSAPGASPSSAASVARGKESKNEASKRRIVAEVAPVARADTGSKAIKYHNVEQSRERSAAKVSRKG